MKIRKIIVEEDNDLLKYLVKNGYPKNKIKSYIRLGFVSVNSNIITKLPFQVKKNDEIEIRKDKITSKSFEILYEDHDYFIVNKEAGILTIKTGKEENEHTLYEEVREYLNKKKEYAFIVNRIDKETSGIVVFVKNSNLKQKLQDNWNQIVKKRGYIAIVSGVVNQGGRIDNFLYEDKMTFSHSTNFGGKRAITNYQPIKKNKKYTMLDVTIETGRKNQIRVHLSEMKHPIIGDKKYRCFDNPLHRLGLHHYELVFTNPITGKDIKVVSNVPIEFDELFSSH